MVDTRLAVPKWLTVTLLGAGLTNCAPNVTIADERSDGGEGGVADAGSGGATSGKGGTPSAAGSPGGKGLGGFGAGGGGAIAGFDAGTGAVSGTAGALPEECDNATLVNGVPTFPLDDYCEMKMGCPETFEDAVARIGETCEFFEPIPDTAEPPVTVRSGCGYRLVGYSGGYTGGGYVFDETSDTLIGAYDWGDTPYPPCNTFHYAGGEVPGENFWTDECADWTACSVCESARSLECRFDCTCSEPPFADSCIDPTSCECYCARMSGI